MTCNPNPLNVGESWTFFPKDQFVHIWSYRLYHKRASKNVGNSWRIRRKIKDVEIKDVDIKDVVIRDVLMKDVEFQDFRSRSLKSQSSKKRFDINSNAIWTLSHNAINVHIKQPEVEDKVIGFGQRCCLLHGKQTCSEMRAKGTFYRQLVWLLA